MTIGQEKPEYSTALHGTVAAYGITPSNTVDLPNGVTRNIFVGTTGDVKVDLAVGGTVIYANVPSGTRLNICASRVYATLTTGTDLVAEY